MKILFFIFFISFISGGAFFWVSDAAAQTAIEKPSVGIEKVSLWRGGEKPGEPTRAFTTTDVPIHCFVQLDSTARATVKLILVAVKADGLPPETKSLAVSYTTSGNQNQVNFDAAPEKRWAAGSYRADVYINGVLSDSVPFSIENPAGETASPKATAQKSSAPKSSVPAPRRIVRKTRRN